MPSVCAGVVPADHEDETQRPEEASDGEVPRRGGPGLRRSGQVSSPPGQMHSVNEADCLISVIIFHLLKRFKLCAF